VLIVFILRPITAIDETRYFAVASEIWQKVVRGAAVFGSKAAVRLCAYSSGQLWRGVRAISPAIMLTTLALVALVMPWFSDAY